MLPLLLLCLFVALIWVVAAWRLCVVVGSSDSLLWCGFVEVARGVSTGDNGK